ncbi:hypothetical protein C8Q77DRAFT_1217931 [Trametes polyzona]|nr:hypothetical protein C8Q77DRAFT_1217931 [Trametes polyzona]
MLLASLWFLPILVVFNASLCASQVLPQTFFPASVPLIVRSPYLSSWYNGTDGALEVSRSWPIYWGRLVCSIRIDGQTYIWTGIDHPTLGCLNASVTNTKITPTRTIFMMRAGPMNVTITYLSPIEPSDFVLQSFPFSYVSVEASSMDGQAHDVQVYAEISGGWLSADWNKVVRWTHYSTQSSVVHNIQLDTPHKYVEVNQQAQDGGGFLAMSTRPGITWQIDRDATCRGHFHDSGNLTNASGVPFGPIGYSTVFAISVALGQIESMPSPVTWAVGYVRNPTIAYTDTSGATHDLSPYYVTRYPATDINQAIDDFTTGFPQAQQRAIALDNAILGNALAISSQYADLVSLAARQTLASLDITVSTGTDGKPNASDVRIFMKDTGSPTTGRVNPVEKMYSALPMLLCFNPSLVGPMLVPLLEAQDGPVGPQYAAQDLGLAYPNATGLRGGHSQGIEETGNMLIMMYAHARFSGDGTLIGRHYSLAKRWADYLTNNTLYPTGQLSADTEVLRSDNLTNLALKGIIATYASDLSASWKTLSLSADGSHFLRTYGEKQSWALMYNLYADRLLGTGIVDDALLQSQTAYYKSLLSSSAGFYGLSIDSDAGSTADASRILFAAATVLDDGVRDGLIEGVWNRASFNQTPGPFPDAYDMNTGATLGNLNANAGPSFGAMYSLLALK